ncbi:MAG: peptidyl-prolyl cis-trans isomerase [Bryobacterales bacterium]|nr:peptidyl-prolyl cis-trans isomerase [Bryobacterales bacterium]
MLKLFRNRGKALRWIMGGILFLVAASMVITLVPNVFGPADPSSEVLAEVSGQPVTTSDVEAALRQLRANNIPPEVLSMNAGSIIENLIAERVLFAESSALGIMPTEEELARWLQEILPDALFPGGQFVGARAYEGFIRQQLRQTVTEFERRVLYELAIELRLRRLVTDGISVTDQELKQRFHETNDSVQVEWVSVDADGLQSQVSPSSEQLREYFESNKLRYRQAEQRPLRLLTVDPQGIAEQHDISDSEIELYYSQNQYRFEQPERVKLRHILFMTEDESEEQSDATLGEAEGVLQQLRDGADFAEMAKEHSDDPGNADRGGDLGWVSRGMMDPAFEEAGFALQVGAMTPAPVKSQFGYHLIRLDERQTGSVKPLSEVREVIRGDLQAERSQSDRYALVERALTAAEQADGDLRGAAEQIGVPFQEFPPFSRSELPATLPKSASLIQAIFDQPVGEVFTASQEETVYIGFVTETVPARDSTFEEVDSTVRQDYVVTEAANLARERAGTLAENAREASAGLASAARRMSLAVVTSDFVRRDGDLGELGPVSALGEEAFTKTDGEIQGPVAIGSRWVVFRTIELRQADEAALAAEGDSLRQTLLSEKRNRMFDYFREQKVREYTENGLVLRYEDRIQAYLGLLQRAS